MLAANGAPMVAVFGSYDPKAGSAEYEQAAVVGRTLGELGYGVVNGGYGGTMEASARGAREAGVEVVGVTCAIWRHEPNQYLTRRVHTNGLDERIAQLVELGSGGYLALPGGTGTLLELAMVWELVAKKMISPRPIVCLGEFWRPLVGVIASVRPAHAELLGVVDSPDRLAEHFPAVGDEPGRIG